MLQVIRAIAQFSATAKRRLTLSVIVGGLLVASGTSVHAQISVDQAVAKVQREVGGRVLSADSENRDGRVRYRVKLLLPDGRVKIVYVDAASGQVSQ